MKEKVVLLVLFLGNLMYYVRKQIEMNMNRNTNMNMNKVIMTK